nr:MAG: rod shape-determining protein MreC [Hyphomicrobiales bacterium]
MKTAGGWKLTRGRGSIRAQLPFILCMVFAAMVLVLGKVEASIFDNARAKFTDLSEPVLNAAYFPVAMVRRWVFGASEFFTVYDENVQLREEIELLRRWQDVALTLEHRLERYESLLNVVPDPKLPSVTARVIGQSNQPFSKTIILDAGTNQNVQRGQAVLDDRGLLGRVFVAGENTSWVLLLTDLNSRIPVVIRPSNRRAILSGTNSLSPTLQLDSPQPDLGAEQVHVGDRVSSTVDGGILPPDLPIGMIIGDENGWRTALFADPDLSDYVRIVDYRAAVEPPEDSKELPLSRLFPQRDDALENEANAGENEANAGANVVVGEVAPQ